MSLPKAEYLLVPHTKGRLLALAYYPLGASFWFYPLNVGFMCDKENVL